MNNKEICWNITARCNQFCKYCHRFLIPNELSYDENKKILDKLIDYKVSDITWTGGEALILDYLDDLIEFAHKNGIRNKLITNGKLLNKERIDKIGPYLDSITLSIDSIDSSINKELGRGENHFNNIKNILDYLKENYPNLKIRINTVISSFTKDINKLVSFLDNYNIYSWRLFKFMPLRELAAINKDKFYISLQEFYSIYNKIKSTSHIKNIESRIEDDMETKYVLILADGSIIITEKGKDIKKGNALVDTFQELL